MWRGPAQRSRAWTSPLSSWPQPPIFLPPSGHRLNSGSPMPSNSRSTTALSTASSRPSASCLPSIRQRRPPNWRVCAAPEGGSRSQPGRRTVPSPNFSGLSPNTATRHTALVAPRLGRSGSCRDAAWGRVRAQIRTRHQQRLPRERRGHMGLVHARLRAAAPTGRDPPSGWRNVAQERR